VSPGARAQVKGLFWNYISIGIDAKAAYNFHSLREARPWAASGRLVNQAWYAYFSCSTGWFCAAPPISRKLKLKARRPSDYAATGPWPGSCQLDSSSATPFWAAAWPACPVGAWSTRLGAQ